MNDDIEQLLGRLTPRGVRPELRPQVLAAVTDQLQAEPASPWLRRSALAVVALLVLGIGMNVWVNDRSHRRLAQIFGQPGSDRTSESSLWLAGPGQPGDRDALAKRYAALQQLIHEFEAVSKGSYHEAPQKDPQMDRDRPGRAGGDRSGCQRLLRMDYRYTA